MLYNLISLFVQLLAVHLDDYSSFHSPFMPSRFVEVVATDALDSILHYLAIVAAHMHARILTQLVPMNVCMLDNFGWLDHPLHTQPPLIYCMSTDLFDFSC